MLASVQDDFGTIRSLSHTPSWGNWKRLCGLLDRHLSHWETPIFQEQVIPYLEWHLGKWPLSVVRYAQHAWIEAIFAGKEVPQLQFANAMHFVSQRPNAKRLERLFNSPYLSNMEVINLGELDMRCDSELLVDVIGAPHMGRLRGLNLKGSRLDELGLEMLATATSTRDLIWLKLCGGKLRNIHPLLHTERLNSLEELDLSSNFLNNRALGRLCSGAYLPSLKVLDLRQNQPLQPMDKTLIGASTLSKRLDELLI